PAWDLLPEFPLRFQPNVFNYRHTPVASLVTSRGCPFSCTFCDRSTSGRRGRFHGVDYVVGLCRRLAEQGVRHILFYDDLFTVSRRRVVELCERFLAEGFRFSWSCNSHPNLLDAETLALMRRAGCWQIAYGVESGSQRVLDVVKHEVKLPRMLETLRLTRAAGIRVKGLLMMGHPTEDGGSLAETGEFLRPAPLGLARAPLLRPHWQPRSLRGGLGAHERHGLGVRAARTHSRDARALVPARLQDLLLAAGRALGARPRAGRRATLR